MVVVDFQGYFIGLDGFLISSQNVPTPNHAKDPILGYAGLGQLCPSDDDVYDEQH